jgi:1,5-anhydro-D-fructose reductase (1,5-anhydro-D-mannitol-forming)
MSFFFPVLSSGGDIDHVKEVRWGIVGCGAVCEVKSGPALQRASGSALIAVMRRDRAKAEDFARRHGVPRVHATADALIDDPDVDAVYIATPPDSHRLLALRAAGAGKPCLVEKPMARHHGECLEMVHAFRAANVPLWVAYYRRALPRFLLVQRLLSEGAIGRLTSVHVRITRRLAAGEVLDNWRLVPEISGGGLFFDLASHCFDLVDFLIGPIRVAAGTAANTAGAYAAEDVTAAAFQCDRGVVGTGIWNFNAAEDTDRLSFLGTTGEIVTAVFADVDVVVTNSGGQEIHSARNPPHVHQPLVQTIVDELAGRGHCASTGESGARTSWVLDRCVDGYYGQTK